MRTEIDDAFIKEWHPRYDQTENDEEEYGRLVGTVAREMKSTGTISKNTFLAIWRWKGAMRAIGKTTIYVQGQNTKAATPAQDEYDSRYAPAFRRAASEPPQRKLGALLAPGVKLPGIGAPTGSTLIHFIHPQTMPIIDIRTAGVLFAFGRIASAECWLETYEEFRDAIKKINRECPGWTLRQIDRALFAYHKQMLAAGVGVPVVREAASNRRKDLEAALASAPVCWTYSSANPKHLYCSVDNKSTTKAAFKFPFAEFAGMLVETKRTNEYIWWELAPDRPPWWHRFSTLRRMLGS
jgi:hypothetical protein